MLWTVISQADVFYQAAQGSRAPFFVRRAGSCGF